MRFKLLRPNARAPFRGSEGAAGWDLTVAFPEGTTRVVVGPLDTVRLPTGVSVELGLGFMGLVLPRSHATTLFNTKHPPIDSDYRGEVHILMHNTTFSEYPVDEGEVLAQLVIVPVYPCPLVEVGELSPSPRGAGAFGSTGNTNH